MVSDGIPPPMLPGDTPPDLVDIRIELAVLIQTLSTLIDEFSVQVKKMREEDGRDG